MSGARRTHQGQCGAQCKERFSQNTIGEAVPSILFMAALAVYALTDDEIAAAAIRPKGTFCLLIQFKSPSHT